MTMDQASIGACEDGVAARTMRQPSLLLFDIDGTLLRTGGAGMRAMQRAVGRLFGEHFSWEGVEVAGRLDPLIFKDVAAKNGLVDEGGREQRRFHDEYVEELRGELERCGDVVRLMPGIREVVTGLRERAIRERDVILGMLTGNYTKAVPIKLTAVGLEPSWFELTAFGDEGATRPELVEVALRKYQRRTGEKADPRRVIVIGDTPRDVECAKAHGCIAFGVATGVFSVETLLEAGADVAVGDLSDAGPLMELLG